MNKELEALDWVRQYEYVNPKLKEKLDIIEAACEVVEIIKRHKMVWFDYLLKCKSVQEYNKTLLDYYDGDEETCEQFYLFPFEFEIMKGVFGNE